AAVTPLLMLALAARRWLPESSRQRVNLVLVVLAAVSVVGLAAARLLTRRVWQLDLDDGVKAAAMIAVLVIGSQVVILARRRLPIRSAAIAGLTVVVVGAFLVRGSTDWLYQLRHRGGLASAAAFQEWARTQTPVDSVFLILPSEPNNDDFY